MSFRIFVINPGSTSTKLALFEDEEKLFETSVSHDSAKMLECGSVNRQLEYRKQVIVDFLKENRIDLTGIDAIVGRGGSCEPVESGCYEVNERMIADTIACRSGIQHASNLGIQLAKELQEEYGGRVFTVDPICVDEYSDLAKVSGIDGIRRKAISHALNMKAVAKRHCEKMGVAYEDCNLIVSHIDGGITVAAHEHGRMVDGTNGAGGEGPFTPTRIGSVAVTDLLEYLETHSVEDARKLCFGGGGLASYFQTSNSDEIHRQALAGDPKASLIWNAMIYGICKSIGAMSTVLSGKVDGIVLTGRLPRFDDLVDEIRRRCSWIAPVYVYVGEMEHEAMALGALRVLQGKEEVRKY